jgi:hypothetical protein
VFRVYSVLLSTDFMYSRIPGDQGGPTFFRLQIFFWRLFYIQNGILQFVSWIQICIQTCPNLSEIVRSKFVCNKFVLVLLQIDIY